MRIPDEHQFSDPFDDPTLRCSSAWTGRLTDAYAEGLSAQDAIRRWKGVPEDPIGGYIPDDIPEQQAPSLAALFELVNPGGPPPDGPLIQDGEFPDGTPEDRSKGWGPLISTPAPRYPTETNAAVRAFPVTQGDTVLGYLWASVTDEAAGYLPRASAGKPGIVAEGRWGTRLDEALEKGLPATEALEQCRRESEHRRAGVIGPGAPQYEFSSLAELQNLANQ